MSEPESPKRIRIKDKDPKFKNSDKKAKAHGSVFVAGYKQSFLRAKTLIGKNYMEENKNTNNRKSSSTTNTYQRNNSKMKTYVDNNDSINKISDFTINNVQTNEAHNNINNTNSNASKKLITKPGNFSNISKKFKDKSKFSTKENPIIANKNYTYIEPINEIKIKEANLNSKKSIVKVEPYNEYNRRTSDIEIQKNNVVNSINVNEAKKHVKINDSIITSSVVSNNISCSISKSNSPEYKYNKELSSNNQVKFDIKGKYNILLLYTLLYI